MFFQNNKNTDLIQVLKLNLYENLLFTPTSPKGDFSERFAIVEILEKSPL